MRPIRLVLPLAGLGLLLLSGCHIDTHRNGKDKNVDIGTPFGSMHVETDTAHAIAQTGLTPYPGATQVHKQGDDNGAADVNLSFGNFKLGVHAVEIETADPQPKVLAFYRHDLARYGAVLTCRGSETVGEPHRTTAGLTCDTDSHGTGDHDLQLRAGSKLRQHLVGITPEDGKTRIGLVALELPAEGDAHQPGEQE